MGYLLKVIREMDYIFKTSSHILAMYLPNIHLKRFFYRLRGTKLGDHVDIAPMVFLEEAYPDLITIEDNVDLGPRVIIVTHDSSRRCVCPGTPIKQGKVIIEKNVYIGAGAIILPGVRIGKNSIIGAGAVVTRDLPSNSVAVGVPARVICTVDEWINRNKGRKL